MWAVGTDGVAYRWDPFLKKWFAYGRRKDFKRIDGAEDGSALAVTDKGDLYYTNGKAAGLTKWVKVGTRVSDVGLGGGVAWIAKTGEGGDDGQVWTAPNSGNGVFKWSQWSGGMVRIDVGPDGNAWGVNERDEVFQFVGGNWKPYAAKAKDIGIGSEGTVWIVGTDIVNNRGGGTLYRRDIRTARWIKDTRRLRDVTAGPADQPAGVSSTNQIWDKTESVTSAGNSNPDDGSGEVEGTGRPVTDPAMQRRVVSKHARNWYRLPGAALDLGLGHRGHIWVIGSDKFAYRWDADRKRWVRHGTRQTFAHIDAADDGGALAVSEDGGLYFTSGKTSGTARWTKVASDVRDVGIGGGQVWITRNVENSGANQVWRAPYDGNGRFKWRRVVGSPLAGLHHIDADRNGNAWGVTGKNEIYRFGSGKWKKQNGRAIDIGIGADNTVWIVGDDIAEQLGGGTLSQFDARTQKWIKEGRRLRSVSAGRGGNPAGTSHGNEVWVRNFGDTPQSKGTNLALGKKTSQSPQLRLRGHAARAVDGKTNGNFSNGSVTDIRSGDTPPWLMVDLGAVYRIDSLRVHNRTDCCGSRLNGAIVEISNTGEWKETDTTFAATISDARQSIDFEVAKTGRYVRVRHTARQVLGIAEIEVFGGRERVTPEPVKIARENITIRLSDDWTKLAGQALDIGVGSGGHMWVIGTDKFAYRWDAAKNEWVRHGKRRDFLRIDTAADGGAMAVSGSGGLFHTPGGSTDNAKWTQVGGKTRDVGIGGGWVWITSTTKTGGGGLTARARYDASGKFSWQRATRGLVHVDAGEDGNAWGVDDQGDIYQLVGGNWRRHGGRKAADIGVGGDNTVWIVDADADDTAGGGTLHRLDPGGGGWVSENARLKTVTAGPQGQPAGINSANEIWAREFKGGQAPVAVAGGAAQAPKGRTAKIADLAGAGLPEELKDVVLEQVKAENGFTTGRAMLNGNPTVVVTYTPSGKTASNIIIWHRRFKFSDYMPDAGGTPLDKVGTLNNTAFVIVPQANTDSRIPPGVVAFLDGLRGGAGNAFPADTALKAGVNLVAGFDTGQMPGIRLFTALFRHKPRNFLLGGTVDRSIFRNVKQTPVKPSPSRNPLDMAQLVKVYGQTFLKNLVLEGEKLPEFAAGPLNYTDAKYEVSGEAGAIQAGFEVSMEMEVTPPQGGSGDSHTITFDGIRVDYDQQENVVILTGDVTAEETKNLVSYRDINIQSLTFEGAMPEGQPLSLKIDGSGKIKSKLTDFEITLEEYNNKYEATLILEGELTLAQVVDHVFNRGEIPGANNIALTKVTYGSNYRAGVASLAGEDVTFAAFKPANQHYMLAIDHHALQLANYLPQLADTPVKKLGLGRSIFIVTRGDLKNPNDKDPLGPTLKVTDENKRQILPSQIVSMLNDLEDEATRKTFGKSIYPLTLRPNSTTVVALYTTDENQVSADADSQKVIDSLGITHDTYILKGFINREMIKAAQYAKKEAESRTSRSVGKESGSKIREVVLPLLDGLDIGFPIPAFQPPKTKDWITFSESRFRLKGIDEKLEIFVSSGMSLKLPGSTKSGVKAMDMVGKVKPVVLKKNLEVEFAATTQLNGAQADETPFARLKALNDPDAEEAVSGLVPTTEPRQGWQKAFGIPFLTVGQMSVGGSFTDGGATGDVKVNVGMQTIVEDQTPGQRLVLKGELLVTDNEITDMVLEIPGSVNVAALPGINDIPGVNELTFSDVKLSRYELAGQVSRRGATLDGVLSRDPEGSDYALYLAAKDTNLGTFSQHLSRKLPSTFGDFPVQSGVMVGSNMATQPNVKVEDLPERAQALFEGVVEEDAEITIARGVSVFTRLEPEKLPESNRIRKLLVNDFGFTAPLLFAGAIEDSGGSATPKVWLAASVPNYKIPGVSDNILEFTGSKFFLEDISGALTGSVEGEMTFKVKGQQFALEDGKVSAAVDGKEKEISVTGTSTKEWNKAFGIPFLTLNRLELDANVKTGDAGPDVDWGIKTNSVLYKNTADAQTFAANGQLLVEENVVTDIVLELPGTVDIRKLPAIGKVPGLNQLSYSDVKLSIYEIAANVLWTGTDKEVVGVFVRDRDKPDEVEYRLYGAIQNTNISNLVKLFSEKTANAIPSTLKEFPINSGVVVIGNQDRETLPVSDLPERVQPLFAGYFPPEKELTIVKGASVYTTIARDNTRKDDPVWGLLFGENAFNLKDPVTFEGSVIKEQEDKAKIRLAASIPAYKIPGVPEDILKFDNSQVVFSNEGGKDAAIVGEMTFKAEVTRKLDGSVTYAGSDGNKDVRITGTSRDKWDTAFGIPGLALSDIALQVDAKRGDTSSTGFGIQSLAEFGGQTPRTQGRVEIADGKLAGASFTLLGAVSLSALPGIKEIPGVNGFTFTDVVLSRNLIAGSNLIAAKTAWDRIGKDKKLDAAFIEKDGTYALLMKVDSFSVGQLSSNVPNPVAGITIPNSVIALSSQDFEAFNVAELPEPVRKTMFDDIVGEKTDQKIKISEGVTVLAKVDPNNQKTLPPPISPLMTQMFQIKEPVIMAGTIGGVFGGPAQAAFYAQIPNALIPGGEVMKKLLNFRDVAFFVRANANAVSQIGFGGAMDFKVPNLDNPNKVDTLDMAGELYADLGTAAPGIEVAGKMTGRWPNPMGLRDFTFEDTEIKVGVNADGSVDIGLGGQAEFKSRKDGLVYYATDFLLGLTPAVVPNKLAVQFAAKKKEGDSLLNGANISHLTMVEMADSLFRGVLTGGASDQMIAQIQPASARSAATKLKGLLKNNSLLDVMQLDKIPLPLLSVRDPLVYFSTPGAGLPPREGIPAPTLGLGIILTGDLQFKLLGTTTDLAESDMRLTINDGLKVKARFPSRELGPVHAAGELDVQAGLVNLGSASFMARGDGGIKDFGLPLPGANAAYELSMKQDGLAVKMDGTAKFTGLERKFGMAIAPTSFDFHSPGACTSPITISAKATYSDFKSFNLSGLTPKVTPLSPADLAKCDLLDVAKAVADAGKKAGGGIGKKALEDAIEAAEGAVELARGDFSGAKESAAAASRLLTPASSYISSQQAFKSGLEAAQKAWAKTIGQLPGLGNALGKFTGALGGAISQATGIVRDATGVIVKGAEAIGKAVGDFVGGAVDAVNPFSATGAALTYQDEYRLLEDAIRKEDEEVLHAIRTNPIFDVITFAPRRGDVVAETQNLQRIILQEKLDIADAFVKRRNLEKQRRNAIAKRRKMEKAAHSLLQLSGNASSCPHGEYWNVELGRCWLEGYALLRTTQWLDKSPSGEDIPKCMAVDQNGALWKDWCSARDAEIAKSSLRKGNDVRFKLNKDGTIQTAGGKCLGIKRNAGKIGKNPQVQALACSSGAETQKWRFDASGRIAMQMAGLAKTRGNSAEFLCITELSKGNRYPDVTDKALHLADCDAVERGKPFDWMPAFGTPDYRVRGRLKFPETAMLQIDGSDVCLNVGAGYGSRASFASCNDKNAGQLFAFAFVDDEYFTIASRSSRTCLDAQDIVDRKGIMLVNRPCNHGETQQFYLAETFGQRARLANRKIGQCVASTNASNSQLGYRSGGAIISAHFGAGLRPASCRDPSTTLLRMTTVDDISNIRPSDQLSHEERLEKLRSDHLYKRFYFHPHGHPTNRIRAEWLPPGQVTVTFTNSSSHPDDQSRSKFFVVPGLTGEEGTVSLRSIGRSGALPHAHHFLVYVSPTQGVRVEKIENNDLFNQAATFRIIEGANGVPGSISLQSVKDASRLLLYLPAGSQGGRIGMAPGSDPAFSAAGASFVAVRQ